MSIPEIQQEIRDNALGIVADNIDSVHAKIGVCSRGKPNTIYSFSDQKTLVDTLGQGPLVEAAAHALAVAGGQVLCVPVASTSTPGSTGTPEHTGPGAANWSINITGGPRDWYEVVLQIVQAGAVGIATFKYSLDGGTNFSPEITIPGNATYVLADTGMTLNFTGGPFAAGDIHRFKCIPPSYSLDGLHDALTALLADAREWRLLHVVGTSGSYIYSAPAIAAAVDAALVAAEADFRYVRAVVEASEHTDAQLITEFASFASRRVGVAAGFADLTSSITGRITKRAAAWAAVARAMSVPISQDLGAVEDGPLPGVRSLSRDERVTPGLDAKHFITLRTFLGISGAYVTSGRCMAPVGSDYVLLQNGFVMDAACRTARTTLLPFLNSKVRVDGEKGTILEVDARTIEATVEAALNATLVAKNHASAVSVKVSRTENILSTQRLPVTIRVVPLGYARAIAVDIGFSNPALKLAA
jgi:hypothetical protein